MTATTLDTWGATSRWADLGGPVHYADFGGPGTGADGGPVPRIVLVHGLGGSHLDWMLVGAQLARHARVLAPDLVGFGLTPVAGRKASVRVNAALLERFVREVAGAPVVLVGNSMGGMISLLTAATHPDAVTGVVGVDAVVPLIPSARVDAIVATGFGVLAVPGLGEKALARHQRATPTALVRGVLNLVCVDPSRVPATLVDAFVRQREQRSGGDGLERAYLQATRSLIGVLGRPRWYRGRLASITAPVMLLTGDRDRLVPHGGAQKLAARHPEWKLVTYPGVGHVPQIEVPGDVVRTVLEWLAERGAQDRRFHR
jgi:pimeloyl-ACP methyl ester carboxylesterase